MTAVKTVLIRRGGRMRHLEATSDRDVPVLSGLVQVMHGGSWQQRWQGVRALITNSRKVSDREH